MSKHLIVTCAAVSLSVLGPHASPAGPSIGGDACEHTESCRSARPAADETPTATEVRLAARRIEAPTGTRSVSNSIVPQLLSWIVQRGRLAYDPKQGVPEVRAIDETELAHLLLKEATSADLSPGDMQAAVRQITALYHHDTRTIYVHRTLDTDSTSGKGALVHELVHFVQYQLGLDRRVECVRALERDAYRIQAMYLRAHGAEPDFDAFTVAARSFCDPALQ